MTTPVQPAPPRQSAFARLRLHLPTIPEALASLLRTIIVALFVLTFVFQPFLIPSESMERTLLVGDFLLVNKQIFAPADRLARLILPYRDVERGDIVVFHHPDPTAPLLIKRVVGIPGDRIRIEDGRVTVNGETLNEPYAAFEPAASSPFLDNFPARVYTDPNVDPDWWRQMQTPDPATANWWSPRASTSCWATTAITATIPASGDSFRARRSSRGRWSSTSRCAVPQARMSSRPRMIDSGTKGNSPRA